MIIYPGMPPQASPRALYQERAPRSWIPESDGWLPYDPSWFYRFEEDSSGNSISVTSPLEIDVGTHSNMGSRFIPPVTCNVQPPSRELRPCIFDINPPDNAPKVLVGHDPDIKVCLIQGKDLLAEIGQGLITGTITVDDKSQSTRTLVYSPLFWHFVSA